MLRTSYGSPDGIQVHTYREGEVYAVGSTVLSPALATVFLAQRWAEPVDENESDKPPARRRLPREYKV